MARICFVVNQWPPHPGGIARSAKRLVDGLGSRHHTIHVFNVGERAAPPQPAASDTTYVHVVNDDAACVEAIRSVDDSAPFDLFHAFCLLSVHPCLEVERGRPVLSSIRGIDGLLRREPCRKAVARSTWVTAVSSKSLDLARQVGGATRGFSLIPNSIDARRFGAWHLEAGNRGVVGTVSTFRKIKNLPLLARAFGRIDPALRSQLLLVGDFLVGERLDQEASSAFDRVAIEEGVAQQVRVTGYVSNADIPEWLKRMHVFSLSSDHEGLPNAVLEAAATGVPIVSTDAGGVRDVFRDGQEALLVPPGNPHALAAALTRVLSDCDLARGLSQGAMVAAQRLNPESELESYLAVYEDLLRTSPLSG